MSKTKLLILSTPRTGSNALCEVLTKTNQFGKVDGFFIGYGEGMRDFTDYEFTHQDEHGNFATKIMWDYLNAMRVHKGREQVAKWLDSFTHILYLRRRDMVAQTVSYFFALQTGSWTSRKAPRDDPEYDFRELAFLYASLQAWEGFSFHWVGLQKRPVMRLAYEDIAQSWDATARHIAAFSGFTLEQGKTYTPDLEIQYSPLKADYIERFREDAGENLF